MRSTWQTRLSAEEKINVPVILPVISFILTFMIFTGQAAKSPGNPVSLRESALKTFILTGILIALSTETLGTLRALTPEGIASFWGVTILITAFIFYNNRPLLPVLKPSFVKNNNERRIVGILAIFALLTFIQGLCSAPNSFDSMSYHLSRVMHWATQRSLDVFPTVITREVWVPPFAEYGVLHLYLLSGSDQPAFLVQWSAYAGGIIAASLIARHLGGNSTTQLVAASLFAALPMSVLQASSTQTDLVAAFLALAVLTWLTAWTKNGFRSTDALWCGLSFGLAILTKTSTLPFLTPFIIAGLLYALAHKKNLHAVVFIMTLLCSSMISVPHMTRVYSCFHTISPTAHLQNELITPRAFVSNLVKNTAVQLTTPSQRINNGLKSIVDKLHAAIGITINDPRINFTPGAEFLRKRDLFYEARAGNLLHTIMGIVTIVLVAFTWRTFAPPTLLYAGSLVTGAVLLILCLKWQPWAVRFHLIPLALGTPLAALVLSRYANTSKQLLLATVILVCALPFSILNNSRPYVGPTAFYRLLRQDQYFLHAREKEPFFLSAADRIAMSGCRNVGILLAEEDEWEYPLWALLKARGISADIRHVHVKNDTARFADPSWQPCVIVGIPPEIPPATRQK